MEAEALPQQTVALAEPLRDPWSEEQMSTTPSYLASYSAVSSYPSSALAHLAQQKSGEHSAQAAMHLYSAMLGERLSIPPGEVSTAQIAARAVSVATGLGTWSG